MTTNTTGNPAGWNVQDTNIQLPQEQQALGHAADGITTSGDAASENAAPGDAAQGAEDSQPDQGSHESSPPSEQEGHGAPMELDTGVLPHAMKNTSWEAPLPEQHDDTNHQVRAQLAYFLDQAKA